MAWFYLFSAGLLEVVWATGLKKLGAGFSFTLAVLTLVVMGASIAALYAAMARLPLGIAYPIWTGLGSIGSVVVSVYAFNHSISLSGILGLILLLAGMVLLGMDA